MSQCGARGLKVYSPEEIEMIVSGDGRGVDRILLHSVNNLAAVLISHSAHNEKTIEALGTQAEIKVRVAWVNAQVKRQEKRNEMMAKVADSSLAYAVVAFLGFIAYSSWDAIVQSIQAHAK